MAVGYRCFANSILMFCGAAEEPFGNLYIYSVIVQEYKIIFNKPTKNKRSHFLDIYMWILFVYLCIPSCCSLTFLQNIKSKGSTSIQKNNSQKNIRMQVIFSQRR